MNQAYGLVAEYVQRRTLKEIGFVSDFGTLPYWKVEAFVIISEEMHELERQSAARNRAKGVKRGRS